MDYENHSGDSGYQDQLGIALYLLKWSLLSVDIMSYTRNGRPHQVDNGIHIIAGGHLTAPSVVAPDVRL
jgi:hypothetical protein